jgi:hypothetical protein
LNTAVIYTMERSHIEFDIRCRAFRKRSHQHVNMKQQRKVRVDAKSYVLLAKFMNNIFPTDFDVKVDNDGKITLTPEREL